MDTKKYNIVIETFNHNIDNIDNYYSFDYTISFNWKTKSWFYSDHFSIDRKKMKELLQDTNYTLSRVLQEYEYNELFD